MVEDGFGNGRAERHHPLRQPRRHTAAVEREIGDAGAFHLAIVESVPADGNRGDSFDRP